MSIGKQAKHLSTSQVGAVLSYLKTSRNPVRNRLIFFLSTKAGLRAREIALLTWVMVTDAEGQIAQALMLQNEASKGESVGSFQ